MKKVILGVVALCVAMSSAWANNVVVFDGDCKKYMNQLQASCKRGNGGDCWRIGLEYSTFQRYYCNGPGCFGRTWLYEPGSKNCAIRETKKALQWYKKACDLGESAGCDDYNRIKKLFNAPTPNERLAE